MSETNFAGKVVLISGGGTGIGRGMALAFAQVGAAVAVCGRRIEPLKAVVDEISALGGKGVAIVADVTVAADCRKAIEETEKKLSALHILVNNAGIARNGPLVSMDDTTVAQIIETNVTGPMLLSKYAIPALAKSASGSSILNIASSVANKSIKDFSVYSAAKAAVVHFTRCLALDLAAQRIRVNCINPGVVDTPIFSTMMPAGAVAHAMKMFVDATPLGRVGHPNDIARAALFLSAKEADWITGAVITVDGGICLS